MVLRRIRCLLPLLVALATSSAADRQVTFLSTSDSHYAAVINEDRNGRDQDTLREMNQIADRSWPDELGGGRIASPRGVVALGDLIDDGDLVRDGVNITERQARAYLADFGLDGTDGLLKYPVFECWGNHDGPPAGRTKQPYSLQARIAERNRLRLERHLVGNLSASAMHCSWDWDDVHLVQLGLYPADAQHKDVHYSPQWHDPQGALSFLKADLAEKVGASGRPVVLMSHCGFDTNWWHPDDWKALYEAAKPYNVVLYLYGHTGTGLSEWAPPGETRKWQLLNDGQTENGFFVVELAGDQLRMVHRRKIWATSPGPDGKPLRKWDGRWEWAWAKRSPLPNAPAAR